MHKPEKDLRPIITNYNAMCDNAHSFLKKLIEPIAQKCNYLIDGPNKFKDKFLPNCKKFDEKNYEILSFDAKKAFNVSKHRSGYFGNIKIIYKNPGNYFKDKDENNRP